MFTTSLINGHDYRNVTDANDFLSLVCAYLNGNGGNLLVSPEVDVKNILSRISPLAPVFARKYVDGCHLVDVPSGNDKPYSFDGRFYVMCGSDAIPASIDVIKDMLLASQVAPLRWERWFSDGFGIENFDEDELRSFWGDEMVHSPQDLIERLERIGLSRQGRFTNATDVLFCKDVASRHPQIRAKAVAYIDKSDDIYQGHETFDGPLLKVFNALYEFVVRHTEVGVQFSDQSPVREQIYQYPLMAIREGLINALVHRDYESYAGTVKVEIQKDRLIISNAGGLYGGMTVEQLKEGHLSAFRNPDMANYLNRRGYMEMTGRGSFLIQDVCRKNGLPEPQWIADDNSVTLILTAAKGMERYRNTEENKEKGKEKGKEKSKEKILAFLSSNPDATTEELIKVTGLSISGVEKNIRELKASGRLRRIGPDRGGHWEVL